jgi:hypothetical protein
LSPPLKEYRGFKQKIPWFETKNTVVSNKEYRGFKQKIPWFETKNTVVSNKKLATTQSWDNVY